MAHFAKLDENNNVINIECVGDEDCNNNDDEAAGIAHQTAVTGYSNWKRTSYNTFENTHKLGGTPFRGNYATIGGTYDPVNDQFYPVKINASWVKDVANAKWVAPIPYPTIDDNPDMSINWDEPNYRWVRNTSPRAENPEQAWDTNTLSWIDL